MWWLNRSPARVPGWSESVFTAVGFGGNYVAVDQDRDLLVVIRWLEPSKMGDFFQMVSDAVTP